MVPNRSPTANLRPLALEWGGQVFDESGRRSTFAVATSLSNVCKLLDVELVTDQSRGVSGYWGRTGHYSIAAFAISLVGDQQLKTGLPASHGLTLCTSGKAAAHATLNLMDKVADLLPPMDIIESYERAGASTRQASLDAMWDELGDATAAVMVQGAVHLAMLWESAWVQGGGASIAASKLHKLDVTEVRTQYIHDRSCPR